MPFQSEAQRRYLWATRPELATRWTEKYGSPKDLPPKKKVANAVAAARLK